jgi:hypothetical protein
MTKTKTPKAPTTRKRAPVKIDGDMAEQVRAECIVLLQQALDRLTTSSPNSRGKRSIGGIYWRLSKVLVIADEHMNAHEGDEKALSIRDTHGVNIKPQYLNDLVNGLVAEHVAEHVAAINAGMARLEGDVSTKH